ncbi:transposase [Streptomyces celluloflavus]
MKHYPPEFKADAVGLCRSRPGATIKSVAADLGVNTETLRNWIRAADERRPGSHSAAQPAAPASDSAEVTALRKRAVKGSASSSRNRSTGTGSAWTAACAVHGGMPPQDAASS